MKNEVINNVSLLIENLIVSENVTRLDFESKFLYCFIDVVAREHNSIIDYYNDNKDRYNAISIYDCYERQLIEEDKQRNNLNNIVDIVNEMITFVYNDNRSTSTKEDKKHIFNEMIKLNNFFKRFE